MMISVYIVYEIKELHDTSHLLDSNILSNLIVNIIGVCYDIETARYKKNN